MIKKIINIMFFPSAVIMIIACFGMLHLTEVKLIEKKQPVLVKNTYQMFMSIPKVLGSSNASIGTKDGTEELICQYLRKYDSPMTKSCHDFVRIFQEHDIDPVFALAVAMCESNTGKKMPIPVSQGCYDNIQPGEKPEECCHNPFGWGVHSRGTLCFNTWQEAYKKVALGLRKKYFDQGLENIEEIMSKYNKISAEERNGSWGKCVNQFIEKIQVLKVK